MKTKLNLPKVLEVDKTSRTLKFAYAQSLHMHSHGAQLNIYKIIFWDEDGMKGRKWYCDFYRAGCGPKMQIDGL